MLKRLAALIGSVWPCRMRHDASDLRAIINRKQRDLSAARRRFADALAELRRAVAASLID
jgi:hypothetical protein